MNPLIHSFRTVNLVWQRYLPLKVANVQVYAPVKAGVYKIAVTLVNEKKCVVYLGQADDLDSRLKDHLSEWESNLDLYSLVRKYDCSFSLAMVPLQNDLERQLNGALFERVVLSPAKVSTLLTQLHPDAGSVFKDAYLVDFLNLPETHSEADLQGALTANLRRFLLELGSDFTFVGEPYRLQVGGRDFFVDLLFYHRGLTCLVVFELKVEQFQPSDMGQLEFYLEALDRDLKKPHELPSIGVLLCATKDHEVVEYALSRAMSPALVAEYQTRLPDKKLLQAKLHEFYELASEEAEASAERELGQPAIAQQPLAKKREPAKKTQPKKGRTK